MKSLRMILPVAAFLFAFAGAFATIKTAVSPEFIAPLNSTSPCTQIAQECGPAGGFLCRAQSASTGVQYRVFDDKAGTICVNQLTRTVANPIVIP